MKKLATVLLLACSMLLGFGAFSKAQAASIEEAPVRDGDKYLGREYNEQFDRMFDNFERATLASTEGTGLWWAEGVKADLTERDGYLHVNYNETLGPVKDNPIYKAASGANNEGVYPYLVFVMKGTGSINDLILSFRYDDNHNDIDVPFTELLDPDLVTLPELTEEYQVYIIDILNTLDGMQYVKEGETPIDAGSAMVGFHLLSNGTSTGVIDIKEVYYSKDPNTLGYTETTENSLLDLFQGREDINQPIDGVYWCGSCGKIIGKHLVMNNESNYKAAGYDVSNATGTYKNMVIRLRGEVGGEDLSLAPFYVTGEGEVWGEKIALSELKGPDDLGLPTIETNFLTLVINFEKSGIQNNINGLQLFSTSGTVYIDQIFFTNMEYDSSSVATDFPVLNPEEIVLWDNFNRETVGATPAFDGNNPVALENGFAFIIAYAGMDRMSIEDGKLVMDCTETEDYLQYTAVSTTNQNDGTYPYAVFKVKTTDEGNLANFRIATIMADDKRSGVVWANGGLKSGTGFNAATELQEGYRYITEDGYTYIVVDLAASGLGEMPEGFDLFYSGTGKLWIDSIFFAKDGVDVPDFEKTIVFDNFDRDVMATVENKYNHYWFDTNAKIVDGSAKFDFTAGASWYKTACEPGHQNMDAGYRYLSLTMKAEAGTDLSTFRFSLVSPDSATVFCNQGKIILADGSALAVDAITEEYQTFVIDLVASGFTNPASEGLCLNFGDWGTGVVYIDEIKYVSAVDVTALLEAKVEELSVKVEPIVLTKPAIAIANNILTIQTVEHAESYEIYINGELVETIQELTYDLSKLNLKEGTYEVTVKAIATDVEPSEVSNGVRYVVPSTNPKPKPSGCQKSLVYLFLPTMALACGLGILIKRKH